MMDDSHETRLGSFDLSLWPRYLGKFEPRYQDQPETLLQVDQMEVMAPRPTAHHAQTSKPKHRSPRSAEQWEEAFRKASEDRLIRDIDKGKVVLVFSWYDARLCMSSIPPRSIQRKELGI
jgi:hypothetical protein